MLAFRQHSQMPETSWGPIHYTNAEERFLELVRRYPKDPVSYVSLSSLYRTKARLHSEESESANWYASALDLLEDGEQKSYEPSDMVTERARLYDDLGQMEDADEAFRKSLTDNPANASARFAYGRFLLRQGRTTELLTVMQSGLTLIQMIND